MVTLLSRRNLPKGVGEARPHQVFHNKSFVKNIPIYSNAFLFFFFTQNKMKNKRQRKSINPPIININDKINNKVDIEDLRNHV